MPIQKIADGPALRLFRHPPADHLILRVENIARMAVRAKSIPDVITLWYGEGDVETPQFIRDAAKASLDAGNTFYVPDMRGLPALTAALSEYQTNCTAATSRSSARPP